MKSHTTTWQYVHVYMQRLQIDIECLSYFKKTYSIKYKNSRRFLHNRRYIYSNRVYSRRPIPSSIRIETLVQRRMVQETNHEKNTADLFWKEYLNGANLQLITPDGQHLGEDVWVIATCVADADLTQSLRRFVHSGDVTLNKLLISCMGLLLSRWSGETDITLGLELGAESEVQQYLNDKKVSEPIFPIRLYINEGYDIYGLIRHVDMKILEAAANCTGSLDMILNACNNMGFQVGY